MTPDDCAYIPTFVPYVPRNDIAFRIAPNPVSDILNVDFDNIASRKNGMFRLLDIYGRTLLQIDAPLHQSSFSIPVHAFPSGNYFLQYIENGEVRGIGKVIIQ